MLGIYLIGCIAAYFVVKYRTGQVLRKGAEPVKIDARGRTYTVCRQAVMLSVISLVIAAIGYIGCVLPYLFVEGVDWKIYSICIFNFGLFPGSVVAWGCYMRIKNARGYIRISDDEIEFKGRKEFIVKISDIWKITYPGLNTYEIWLKEKNKKGFVINCNGFYHINDMCSVMERLRDDIARANGRDKSLAHRFSPWKAEMALGRYVYPVVKLIIILLLIYACYCCIDYDFLQKDYTAEYNALYADNSQSQNAWPYYVQAATGYVEPREELRKWIDDCLETRQFNLSNEQTEELRAWFESNAASWGNLQKAAAIDYCNATYQQISMMHQSDEDDFSTPSDSGYKLIRNLYQNVNACRLAGIVDLDRLELFEMQIASSRHFSHGKSVIDQLAGYGMLIQGIKFYEKQAEYELDELNTARRFLKEQYPAGVPRLNVEGEVLIYSGTYDDLVNKKKIPVQTPLNPLFLMLGSRSGTERHAKMYFTRVIDNAYQGVEVERSVISFADFHFLRQIYVDGSDISLAKACRISQRTEAWLQAAYLLIDHEEYRLVHGCYPADVAQLRQAGLTSELPDDPQREDKIIYLNDGQRAILYSVGPNAIDDGGYNDEKKSEQKRDDIIYWKRELEK